LDSVAPIRHGAASRSLPRLVIGNWKLHGSLAANAMLLAALAGSASDCAMAVCVPFPYIAQAQAALRATRVAWGAQDASEHVSGAYTGDVSAAMLAEFGCRYALVGHSERRHLHHETDAQVAAKAVAVLEAALTPVVCVGETLAERERGAMHDVILRQLDAVATRLGDAMARTVVAYEPVWAIGTGRTATPAQAQEVHALLRSQQRMSRVPLLYGGSVKAANAAALFAEDDIDGALVGGASLDAKEFLAIVQAAAAHA